MNTPCDVILDLIPIVKDRAGSEATRRLVEEHIADCEACRAEYDAYPAAKKEGIAADERTIRAMKMSLFTTKIAALFAGIILSMMITQSHNIYYNILLMPALGVVYYFLFRSKYYLLPIAVFALTFLWQLLEGFGYYGFYLYQYPGWFWPSVGYSMLYSGLSILGVLIAYLLKFAFSPARASRKG